MAFVNPKFVLKTIKQSYVYGETSDIACQKVLSYLDKTWTNEEKVAYIDLVQEEVQDCYYELYWEDVCHFANKEPEINQDYLSFLSKIQDYMLLLTQGLKNECWEVRIDV